MSFSPMQRTATRTTQPMPGPGAYSPIRKSVYPEFSFRGRVKDVFKPSAPGPGAYNPVIPSAEHAITSPFRPQTYRKKPAMIGNPGPNAYNVPPPVHCVSSITLHSRTAPLKANEQVSPQRYRPDRYFETIEKQQGFTMRPRTGGAVSDRSRAKEPGPGSYSPDFKKAAKSSTREVFINRPKTGKPPGQRDQMPGPGAYNVTARNHDKEFAGAQLGVRWNKAVCTF